MLETPRAHVSVYHHGDLVFLEWRDKNGVVRTIPFQPEHAKTLADELRAKAEVAKHG